eukprot:6172288-Pleurochrysis_carterae.AAC.3
MHAPCAFSRVSACARTHVARRRVSHARAWSCARFCSARALSCARSCALLEVAGREKGEDDEAVAEDWLRHRDGQQRERHETHHRAWRERRERLRAARACAVRTRVLSVRVDVGVHANCASARS